MSPQTTSQAADPTLSEELIALAGEKDSGRRLELLRRIAGAYSDHVDHVSATERYFFAEVLGKLIDKFEAAHRVTASRDLASLSAIPDAVALKLATDDDVNVAKPILADYRGLSDKTLVTIASSAAQDRLKLIAARERVPAPVTDVVVRRGDRAVVRTLAANNGAEFSPGGMNTLIDKASNDDDLQAIIVERGDLTPAALARLLPIISGELAKRLRGLNVDIDEGAIAQHLGDWAADRKRNIAVTDTLITQIRAGGLKLDEVVQFLVKEGRLFDAASVIGAMSGLDRVYGFHLMVVGKLETAIVLMRSIGLGWDAAEAFLTLRAEKIGATAGEQAITHNCYKTIEKSAAERIVRFMKARRAVAA